MPSARAACVRATRPITTWSRALHPHTDRRSSMRQLSVPGGRRCCQAAAAAGSGSGSSGSSSSSSSSRRRIRTTPLRSTSDPNEQRPVSSNSGPPLPQQLQPPHIQYSLNSTIGSYTDAATCSVHFADDGDGDAGCRTDCDSERGLVHGATVRFSDSAALRLRRRAQVVWEKDGPQRVLIVKKPVPAAAATLQEMATWLEQHGLQVFVERSVAAEMPQYAAFDPATTSVDFAITLGGDGTVLHMASLFPEDVPLPPVMCFAMGTLGFLTPFDASQFRLCFARALAANRRPLYCTLRTRKCCSVLGSEGQLLRVHHILNECVIDRGASPSSVYLEVYVDGSFVTTAEADGLIIATPSGSTAYSMSAGGSMVAPSVPCTLLTPLSPHSLSFRPLIIPENADVLVRVPLNARSHARASFDGKHPMRIQKGCSVHFRTSLCPLPLVNIGNLDTDWYEGLTHKLKWNQAIRGVPNYDALAAGRQQQQPLQQQQQPLQQQQQQQQQQQEEKRRQQQQRQQQQAAASSASKAGASARVASWADAELLQEEAEAQR